jgi:hypothetical protein
MQGRGYMAGLYSEIRVWRVINTTENALFARENDIVIAIIGLNKKNHILEDRLLALELLVRQINEQAIGIQYTRNVFYGLLS